MVIGSISQSLPHAESTSLHHKTATAPPRRQTPALHYPVRGPNEPYQDPEEEEEEEDEDEDEFEDDDDDDEPEEDTDEASEGESQNNPNHHKVNGKREPKMKMPHTELKEQMYQVDRRPKPESSHVILCVTHFVLFLF